VSPFLLSAACPISVPVAMKRRVSFVGELAGIRHGA
jgi:hypothetical protein